MNEPAFLRPFVLPIDVLPAERHGNIDLYLPYATGRRPAVLLVHGGPIPADRRPTPRNWPVYQGYGSAIAARGAVGATVDHRLYDIASYPLAAADVAAAVDALRADERVDPERIALWFFSAGALLSAGWLAGPPRWLRCLAATYPLLGLPEGVRADPALQPVDAVRSAGDLPIVLTRVGRERPHVAATVDAFVRAARRHDARLQLIEVPDGQHGFDHLDHDDGSRAAVERAIDAVVATLG